MPRDLQQLLEAAEAELAEERAARLAASRWRRWAAWWGARAAELKTAAVVTGALVALVTGWQTIRMRLARNVGQPDTPKASGERLFIDRVDEPKR